MLIRQLRIAGLVSLTAFLGGCASNTAQVQHEAAATNVRGMCAVELTSENQGHRSARLIRDPDADSGFISGSFPAEIKVWVTAPSVGTKLVTLHARPEDEAVPIPVERITAVALQSCEVVEEQDQGAGQRVLTTSN
jgi:hypothetical protein